MPKYYLKYLLKYSVIKNITKYYHTTFSHLKWKWLAQHCLCLFEVASFYFLWESLDEQLFYFWDFLPPALNHIFTKIVAGFFFWKRELSLKTLLFEVSKECWGQELNQDDGLDIKIDNMRARTLKAWNYEMLVQDQ